MDGVRRIELAQQLLEALAPLLDRKRAQVSPIEMQEIEGHEHEALGAAADRGSERLEIRAPCLVLNDDLAVDDSTTAPQQLGRAQQRLIFGAPVVAITRERTPGCATITIWVR